MGAHVLCMSSPWEDATSIELTRSLPLDRANPNGGLERGRPWAVVTAAGERCELATRPLGRIAGLPIGYACAGSALLLGVPTRGRTWTQARAAGAKATTYRRVALASAWW